MTDDPIQPPFGLQASTPMAWLETVLGDFDQFLQDHAACERKASATAMTMILHYRDRERLVDAMVDLAREELDHFSQVYALLKSRGQRLSGDAKDPYIGRLRRLTREGSEPYFLDRLILASVIEGRGCERFGLIAKHAPTPSLRQFYAGLTRSEARHQHVFLDLAKIYFPATEVSTRHHQLLRAEADIMLELPLRAALH